METDRPLALAFDMDSETDRSFIQGLLDRVREGASIPLAETPGGPVIAMIIPGKIPLPDATEES